MQVKDLIGKAFKCKIKESECTGVIFPHTHDYAVVLANTTVGWSIKNLRDEYQDIPEEYTHGWLVTPKQLFWPELLCADLRGVVTHFTLLS